MLLVWGSPSAESDSSTLSCCLLTIDGCFGQNGALKLGAPPAPSASAACIGNAALLPTVESCPLGLIMLPSHRFHLRSRSSPPCEQDTHASLHYLHTTDAPATHRGARPRFHVRTSSSFVRWIMTAPSLYNTPCRHPVRWRTYVAVAVQTHPTWGLAPVSEPPGTVPPQCVLQTQCPQPRHNHPARIRVVAFPRGTT
jgi:hypothetical protein